VEHVGDIVPRVVERVLWVETLCRLCGARVFPAPTVSGSVALFDSEPHELGHFEKRGDRLAYTMLGGGYRPHLASCPSLRAADWRAKQTVKAAGRPSEGTL